MPNRRLPRYTAGRRELQRMRQSPDYSSGGLIDAAADLAMEVGQPPRRFNGKLGNAVIRQAARQENLADINARMESELIKGRAAGWDSEV